MVKDLRTGVQTSDIQAVMDGDIDAFIEGKLRGPSQKRARRTTIALRLRRCARAPGFWR